MNELNPNHPVTAGMREQWFKMVAALLHKFDLGEVVISTQDLEELTQMFGGEMPVVVAHEKGDGLHLKLVPESEGQRLALQARGLLQ